MKKIMTWPEFRQRLESVRFVVPPPGAKHYSECVTNEVELWTRVIQTANNIQPEQ